jgi:hypothetical protein
MKPERIAQVFDTLINDGEAVLKTQFHVQFENDYVDDRLMAGWAVNAQTLIRSVFGTASDHYERTKQLVDGSNFLTTAVALLSVLKAAKSAWDQGLSFDMQALARADVEADLIEQAGALLDGGWELPAAVLAGAVLEEHLRAIAPSWGVATQNAQGKPLTLDPLNNELKKAGAYDGIMQKRITYFASLRNDAAHGNWQAGRKEDVRSMIGGVIDICDRVAAK